VSFGGPRPAQDFLDLLSDVEVHARMAKRIGMALHRHFANERSLAPTYGLALASVAVFCRQLVRGRSASVGSSARMQHHHVRSVANGAVKWLNDLR